MNERKIEILSHMSDGDSWTSNQIALWCGISLTNSSELLRRYRNQGLVKRVRNHNVSNGYLYQITEIGINRLNYFSSPETQTSTSIATHIGLTGKSKRVLDRWVLQQLGTPNLCAQFCK